MHVATLASELAPRSPARRRGVVMTMGALHEGHLALVRAALASSDEVVVTIFVNPLQFNDDADLERYPRTLDADLALLEPLGIDAVFVPSVDEIYPPGETVVTVASGQLGRVFEGASRPGHFDGMLTVVLRLLTLTGADAAFFGEKDAQQLMAVRHMVAERGLPVEIVGVPTVRDADGLALSSRNSLLTDEQRTQARALHRSLVDVTNAVASGESLAGALDAGRLALAAAPGIDLDYLDVLEVAPGEATVAVAAIVGGVRLIDNVRVPLR